MENSHNTQVILLYNISTHVVRWHRMIMFLWLQLRLRDLTCEKCFWPAASANQRRVSWWAGDKGRSMSCAVLWQCSYSCGCLCCPLANISVKINYFTILFIRGQHKTARVTDSVKHWRCFLGSDSSVWHTALVYKLNKCLPCWFNWLVELLLQDQRFRLHMGTNSQRNDSHKVP